MDRSLVTSDDVVYRTVQNETLVVQLESGEIYYFSPKTREFLDVLKRPVTLSTHPEKETLHAFCQVLLEKQILKETDDPGVPLTATFGEELAFLRKDEKTIDDIVFLCP